MLVNLSSSPTQASLNRTKPTTGIIMAEGDVSSELNFLAVFDSSSNFHKHFRELVLT